MKWKFLILFIFVFLVSSSSFLLAGSGEPLVYPPNITILHPVNNTVYTTTSIDLNFTSNESLNNASYSLDNNANISLGSNSMTYQETADEIGLEGTWSNGANTYDGDWSTFGDSSDGVLYINYTKPTFATNFSLWNVKSMNESVLINKNYTLLAECWAQDPLQFKVSSVAVSGFYSTTILCRNSPTTWYTFYSSTEGGVTSNNDFYEEAMWWNTTTQNTTLTSLSEGLHNVTIYGNNSDGNMGQSSYVYFTVSTVPSAKKFVIGAYTTIGGRRIISS